MGRGQSDLARARQGGKLAANIESTRAAVIERYPAYRDPGMKVMTQAAIVGRDIEATSKR